MMLVIEYSFPHLQQRRPPGQLR